MELSPPVFNNFDPLPTGRRALFAAAILLSFLFLLLAFWSPALLAISGAVVFAAAFVASRTVRWLVFPAALVLSQFIVVSSEGSFEFLGLAIFPIDWVAILLVMTVLITQAVSGQRKWVRTGLDGAVGLFLGAIAFSLVGVPNLKAGIVGCAHHFLYFLVFYAMVADWKDVPLENIWKAFLSLTSLAALLAVWQFFATGGARSLGFGGDSLNHMILPLLCFQLAALSLWEKLWRWFFVAFLFLAIVATQTRGVWIGAGIIIPVWIVSGFLIGRFKVPVESKKVAFRFAKLAVLFLFLLLLITPFLGQVGGRAEQLETHTGTVYLRLFLWGEALKLFMEHPINGIGLGQFAGAVEQSPAMKNLGVFEMTRGLSAHNIFFSVLAEAGVLGGVSLLVLFAVPVRLAWKGVQKARTLEELRFGWGLFLYFSYLALTVFVAGSWAYYFTFFLGFLILFLRKLETVPSDK